MSMKNPLTPAGIEPATFRFVAQYLNHCATAVPQILLVVLIYVLPEDGPFGSKHVVNKSPLYIIKNP